LGIEVDIDPSGLPLGEVRSSLHAVVGEGRHLSIQPGERANRDFILRLSYGEPEETAQSLTLTPDAEGEEGTFRLTVLPPTSATASRPRDVVLVLDRSGSMMGWKMVAARRAAARIVDTLTAADRFAVLAFDDRVEHPAHLGGGLHAATDRNRFRAVEFLATVDSRGGTELLAPLTTGLKLLAEADRDRVLVLVTDGQVGNEDQILARSAQALAGVRVHTVGIDQAVNAGFLGRLAAAGGGRCELVESEDRLDAAMDHIHRRIGAPVVAGLSLATTGFDLVDDTVSPGRLPDLFPGAPLVVTGRYRGVVGSAEARITGRTRTGEDWSASVSAGNVPDASLTSIWARGHLRDLEDRYASAAYGAHEALERRIVEVSQRFGVLCRFTAWVAVDERVVVEDGKMHRVIQPVEPAAGWDMLARPAPVAAMPMMLQAAAMPYSLGTAAPAAKSRRARMTGGRMFQFPTRTEAGGLHVAEEAEIGGLPEPSTTVRALAAQEAARLRAAADAPDYEKREMLADLGTRLEALLRQAGDVADLRHLVLVLSEEHLHGLSPQELAQVWDRALAVLDALAADTAPGRTAPKPKAFWKR
jgi:Ca-activated chloride channel family protein